MTQTEDEEEDAEHLLTSIKLKCSEADGLMRADEIKTIVQEFMSEIQIYGREESGDDILVGTD